MRVVITRVLPVPAPARTSSGPSVVETASRWAGFSVDSSALSACNTRLWFMRRGAGVVPRGNVFIPRAAEHDRRHDRRRQHNDDGHASRD